MKKFLSLVLTVSMIFTMLISAQAEVVTVGEWAKGYWELDDEGVLTVYGYGAIVNISDGPQGIVTVLPPWNEHSDSITKVVIEKGITSIGSASFSGYTNLTEISISDSVYSIEDNAFNDCTSLATINIPDVVRYIGSRAFKNTAFWNDESNWDENGVLYLGKHLLFAENAEMTEYTIKDGTVVIADGAFFSNGHFGEPERYLEKINIPNSVKYIGASAFEGCSKLNNLVIPDSVEYIGVCAFYGCTSLSSITLPNMVEFIYYNAFENTAFWNDENNWDSDDALYLNNYLLCVGKSYETIPTYTEYTIKNGTTIIAGYAFSGVRNLTKVNFPATIKNICSGAFVALRYLEEITLPSGIEHIGDRAFDPYSDLISDNHGYLGSYLIDGYGKYIKDGTVLIADNALSYNEIVMIPESVRFIGCGNLTSESRVCYAGSETAWNNVKVYDNEGFDIVYNTTEIPLWPQTISVTGIPETVNYGDSSFKLTVTPDENSQLNNFTFESSNTDVAEISNDGTVTIKSAGKTNITVKQAGNEEYAEFTKTQELVVNKVEIVVTADAKSKRRGTDDPALTYQYTGTLVGEDAFTGELSRQNGETIGKYDILQGTLSLGNNYNITYNKAVFEILEKTPQNIVIADIPAKTYGDASFALTVTPDATANLTSFTYDSSDKNVAAVDENGNVTIVGVGETTISVTESGNEDYAETTVTKKLTVNKAPLEIKVDNIEITYGEAFTPNITYTGFVGEESEAVLTKPVSVKYPQNPTAGEHDIILSGAEAANYEISYADAKLTVNKKDVTITELKVFDKVHDETTDAEINTSTLEINGVIAGDDVTIDLNAANAQFDSAEIGEGIPVTISNLELAGTDASNYNLTASTFNTTAKIKESTTAEEVASQITKVVISKDSETVILPEVPDGYKIELKASADETVIKADGTIAPVENDTPVELTLTITNQNDPEDTFEKTVTVTVPKSTEIEVKLESDGNGTVTGDGNYLARNDVTITATPNSGYKFDGWYDGETLVSSSASYTFKAGEENILFTAKFSVYTPTYYGGGGGGSFLQKYTVKFDTNGGNKIANVSVKKNETISNLQTPVKEGYAFAGWYMDKELTKAFSEDTKITSAITLYAKWQEANADNSKNEIVLTIGQKNAKVFGEDKTNDVAPLIRNDITMLPGRFIAEALGANVEWNEAERKVTITKDEVVIIITIDSEYAEANGEKVKLLCPAFIENDRTYIQIRFLSERLGATVDWEEETQTVTITK